MKRLVIVLLSTLCMVDCLAMSDSRELAKKEMEDQYSLLRLRTNTNFQQEELEVARVENAPKQDRGSLPESFQKPGIFSRDVLSPGASPRNVLHVKEMPEIVSTWRFEDETAGSFVITDSGTGQGFRAQAGNENSMIGSLMQDGESLRASSIGFTDLSQQVIAEYQQEKSKLSSGFVVQHVSLLELLQIPEYQTVFDKYWKMAGVDYSPVQARSITQALAAILREFDEQSVTVTMDDKEALHVQGVPTVLPSSADLIKAIIAPLQARSNESRLGWNFPYPPHPEVVGPAPKLHDSTGQETTAHKLWCGD